MNKQTGTTGQKCQESGVYYCVRHPLHEIQIIKGDAFPHCKSGGHETKWIVRQWK